MNGEILKYNKLIETIDEITTGNFDEIANLLTDKHLGGILNDYNKNKIEYENSIFNIFNLVSDKYFYENLHSDIISVFLDPKGAHNERNKYLKIFISHLQKINPELGINLDDFSNSTISRESSRIDILIQGHGKEEKAIIIENKIYNAPDTHRQLPKYVDKLMRGKVKVVAIVYLPLDPNKKPNDIDWTDNEKIFIWSKLIHLPAFNRTCDDLFNGWLKDCIKESEGDVKTILIQYSKLIQKIGGFIMDKKFYERFYNEVATNEKYKSALEIKSILESFPSYIAERIVEKFKTTPSSYEKIQKENNTVIFEKLYVQKEEFTIRINCELEGYLLRFWDFNYSKVKVKNALKVIQQLGLQDYFKVNSKGDELERFFEFPRQEQDLYQFIIDFKKNIDDLNVTDTFFTD